MHKILKKYYILMLIFLIPNILIVFSCTYTTKYQVITPGLVSSVDGRMLVEDGFESNDLYCLSVYAKEKSTLFQNVLTNLSHLFTLTPISTDYDHMSTDDWYKSSVIQKNQSLEMSAIQAYTHASKIDSSISINYEYTGIIIMRNSVYHELFEIGDIITHIDGVKLTTKNNINPNSEDYIEIKENSVFTYIRDNKTTTKVFNVDIPEIYLSDSTLITHSNYLYYTTSTYDKFNIIDSTPKYNIANYSSTGPSAGMMQTLSLYNQLIEEELTVFNGKNIKIAGTGTIETDGSIGAIGGVTQKVYSAHEAGCSYLFVSEKNYDEAKESLDNINNKNNMELIKFTTFEGVLEWLIQQKN